ncbi:hypothetical protein QTP88_011038 [Uroleucon formosanum]
MQIQYHTYQLPEDKRLSVVIRNLQVPISEETIFSALWELQYEAISVTRLQNYLKVPISIVAVLLQQSSKHIYSLDRLLHCIVKVEPRKPFTDITQLLLKGISVNITQVVLPELDSDHNPDKIILSTATNAHIIPRKKLINGKPNWCIFSNLITDNLQIPIKINSKTTADQAISHLTDTITMAAQNCTVSSQKRPTQNSLPKKILTLIQHKHLIRRLWQQYRRPEDRCLFNVLTKQVRDTLDNYRINSYKKYLSKIHPADPNLWRCMKRLINKDLHITLASTFKPNDIFHRQTCDLVKNSALMEDFATQIMLAFINSTEIKNNIKSEPHRKSPGADQITNQMLKKLPNKAITFLTNLFNGLLNIGYFPLSWKKVIIIVLNKPGKDKSNSENYRPISLLTAFSKLFEKSLQCRLLEYLNSVDAILKFQYGFKSHHSTSQQLLRLTETISNSFENKNHTGAVFLDIAKGFDRVWHDGLFYKLKYVNIPKYIMLILKSFLNDRCFVVRLNETQSSCRPIQAGIPQGSKLGLILFNFYISDIPQTTDTNIALFADDTTIFCTSSDTQIITTALQKHLNKISLWCLKWKIIINPSKSQAVFFPYAEHKRLNQLSSTTS